MERYDFVNDCYYEDECPICSHQSRNRIGRATGTSQIIGMALVETTSVDSVLTARNPFSI